MMFFEDHLKQIYSPKGSELKFDPLVLDRALVAESEGRLNDLLIQWRAGTDGLGDVSDGAKYDNAVMSADAEDELVRIARGAFGLPEFPDCLDATALEYLCDFLEWMEGKGTRGSAPLPSPLRSAVSPAV